MTQWFTHINRGVIDGNRKHGRFDPPITFRKGKRGKATYCMEVALPPDSRMVYSPHEPILPCGARLVVVSSTSPQVIS